MGGGARGAEPTEGRKKFRKFVGIGKVKFNNFTKIEWIFCPELDKNIRIIKNFMRPGGAGAEPPDASEFLWIFSKFSSCNFNFFLKFVGRPPGQKMIIQCFPY